MQQMKPLGEAADYLGVSTVKMWQLVRDGLLKTYADPLDKRRKLFKLVDLNRFKKYSTVKPKRKTA